MRRMSALLVACLLSVCVFADEAAGDCSSEIAVTKARDSQIKQLESQAKESSKAVEGHAQQLIEVRSQYEKSNADLNDLKSSSQKIENDLRKQIKDMSSKLESADKSKDKVKELTNKLEKAEKSKDQIKELTNKLESAEKSKAEVNSALQECGEKSGEHQQISMMDLAAKMGSMTNGVVQHALQQTDLDENIMSKVSTHVGTAKDVASKMKDRVTSMDYAGALERVSTSETYQKMSATLAEKTQTLRPHFDKAHAHLQPALAKAQDLMGPALTKAQPALEKAQTKLIEVYAAGTEAVQAHVVPVLKRGGSAAQDQLSAAGLAQLDKLMTPVFASLAKAVPEHEKSLPEHSVDRALFLLVVLIFAYQTLYFIKFSLRIALRLTGKTSWMSLKLFRLMIMIPLKLVFLLIDTLWWVVTLFYCCGLCRREKKAAKLAAKAKKQDKKSVESDKKAETVTLPECLALLETSKKKNRLEDGAQQLAKSVKGKKPLQASTVQGKILTKEVFLQACKKCEVNIKKLDL